MSLMKVTSAQRQRVKGLGSRCVYLLILFAVGHTLGFQYLNLRGPVLLALLILSIMIVLAFQGLGIALTLSRRSRGS